MKRLNSARLLIYSHDSFGLGHLRRCRAIAHSLVERYKGISILILSGSPIIASFDFRARVDFVRIPGIIKLYNGEYVSLGLHLDLKDTLAMRSSIIRSTAEAFDPDLLLVDKEPLGLKGEVLDTLKMLKKRGATLVLGLRDVMDEPMLLRKEWEGRNVIPIMRDLYDEIWVYGLPQVYDPLSELDVPQSVRDKMIYTGYLPRTLPREPELNPSIEMDQPYILVTGGGGGDGEEVMDWVLRAYESDPDIPLGALLVFGPFMRPESQKEFMSRAGALGKIKTITFDSHMEFLIQRAAGIVAMGGYNTFCEILSFNKPSVIIPRIAPRQEQLIRATRAHELGLAKMLDPSAGREAGIMARALRDLPGMRPPSEKLLPGMLDGFESISNLVERRIKNGAHARLKNSLAG